MTQKMRQAKIEEKRPRRASLIDFRRQFFEVKIIGINMKKTPLKINIRNANVCYDIFPLIAEVIYGGVALKCNYLVNAIIKLLETNPISTQFCLDCFDKYSSEKSSFPSII